MFTPHAPQHTGNLPLWARRALLLAALGTTAFGAVLVCLPSVAEAFFNLLLFGGPPGFGAAASAHLRFVHAVLGAVMVGWGSCMAMLARGPVARGSIEAWWMISAPLAAWFIPDTAVSLLTGHAPNAALNLVFAVLFAVPLGALYGPTRAAGRAAPSPAGRADGGGGGGDFQRR
jgi:hypothetical protein